MTQEEILAFLTRKRTQEELREYVNPDGKLNYFGTQKILNDYCNRWKLNECESYLYVLLLEEKNVYIGETEAIFKRFRRHFSLNSNNYAEFEKIYPAKSVYEVVPLGNANKHTRLLYENALTVLFANKLSMLQVRGGHFSNPNINIAYDTENLRIHGYSIFNEKIRPIRENTYEAFQKIQKMYRIYPNLDIKAY